MSSSSEKHETSANNRSHTQGRHDREYTPAQIAAVNRVRKCRATDYYAILDIESPSSENEIRKAYRKLALIMHPDKNSAPGADEAFKMISKAFQILSDPDKKRIFDQTGTDPDSRSAGPSFSRAASGGGGGPGFQQFQGDISPEELFNMFFGGGMGGMGGQFGGFGGPGIRIHTFGGGDGNPFTTAFGGPAAAYARQRQQQQQRHQQDDDEQFSVRNLSQLLPLLLLFGLPLLFSLFGDGSTSTGLNAAFKFSAKPPYTLERSTTQHHIPYFINPKDAAKLTDRKLSQLDKQAEVYYIRQMRDQCSREYEYKQNKLADAKGWFFVDTEAYEKAQNIPLTSCDKLDDLGIAYTRY